MTSLPFKTLVWLWLLSLGLIFFSLVLGVGVLTVFIAPELDEKSFEENKIEIYGKVIYSAYKHDTVVVKSRRSVAGDFWSPVSNGYFLIVQIDTNRYKSIRDQCTDFNTILLDQQHVYFNPLPFPETNLHNLLMFKVEHFHLDYNRPLPLPDLPKVNDYVKIYYDPRRHLRRLFYDSTTLKTPSWSSIP